MIGHTQVRAGAFARHAFGTLFACAAALGATTVAGAKGVSVNAPETAFQTITSSGPLNQIFLGVDVAAQVAHTGDGSYEIYPPSTTPGDYGTFLVVANVLYAPDFIGHGGTATGSIGTNTLFTPISQTAVGGTGASSDPFTVTTVVGVGTTGLTITQVDSYVVGQESYRTDVTVANGTAAAISAILYRAFDCYLGGSDSGFGVVNGTAPGCSVNPNNSPAGRIEQIIPLNGGNNYYETGYNEVWAWIGTHQPFPNTCDCTIQEDNGSGISWNITVPANGSITRSNLTVYSPVGTQPLFVTKTADAANANPGAADGYTITVTNPNATGSTLNSITDTLPAGFTYTLGSTTGATTANPTVNGQVLTWAGPFSVPAGGTTTLHFGVTVSSVNGTYTNQATADAGADTVAGSGPTAPITVGGGGPPPPPPAISTPTLGAGALALLALILLAAGLFARRRASD
ncbi:MAG TPA: hypothetical protein VH375_08390 [Rhodanobacteraceae bacterium]